MNRLLKEAAWLKTLLGESEQRVGNLSKNIGDSSCKSYSLFAILSITSIYVISLVTTSNLNAIAKKWIFELETRLNSSDQQMTAIRAEANKVATLLVQEQEACRATREASILLGQ